MERTKTYKTKIWMLILILILQIILPTLTTILESEFTLKSMAATQEWDISENGDATVKATFDDETGLLTISGTGRMTEWDSVESVPWFNVMNNVTSVKIESGVTNIGSYTFGTHVNLTSITIESELESIGSSAFQFCSNLGSITIPNSVTSIGSYAFWGCDALATVNLPENLTTISEGVFSACSSLTTLNLPANVTVIEGQALSGTNSLQSITVDENNANFSSESGVLYNKDKTKLICYPSGKTETTFTMPSTVTEIESYAFYSSKLVDLTISENVTSIGSFAFIRCSNLQMITLPEGLEKIQEGTFEECENLEDILIPQSVTSIANFAFNLCVKIRNITIPAGVTTIEPEAFTGMNNLIAINVNENNENYSSENGILYNKDKTTLVRLPIAISEENFVILDTVATIGENAFKNCSNITKVTIPDTVTSIGENSFTGLENVTIYCRTGSYAANYAIGKNLDCQMDNDAPIVEKIEGRETNEEITIVITATDNGVGLPTNAYSIDRGETWTTNTFTVESIENITIMVKDNLGNIATKEITEEDIEFEADTTAPTITSVIQNPTEWISGDVTLTVNAEDAESGVAEYSFDGGQTWQQENTKTYSEETEGIIIKVKDNEGNVAEYTEAITLQKELRVNLKEYEEKTENNVRYLINIQPNTTIGQVKANIETNGTIKIYKDTEELTDETAVISTGMRIEISEEEKYIVVVSGDTNADGMADIRDILAINKHRLNKTALEGAYLLAGDVTEDGTSNIMDILQINKYRLGKIDNL